MRSFSDSCPRAPASAPRSLLVRTRRRALGRCAGLECRRAGLVIAAHPDDESRRSSPGWARGGRSIPVSLADSGLRRHNLIGNELGEALAPVAPRSLAALRIDGGRVLHPRLRFGFSKTRRTFRSGARFVLRERLTVVRAFRPHVIVSFSGTPRDGPGHLMSPATCARLRRGRDTVRFRAATRGLGGCASQVLSRHLGILLPPRCAHVGYFIPPWAELLVDRGRLAFAHSRGFDRCSAGVRFDRRRVLRCVWRARRSKRALISTA